VNADRGLLSLSFASGAPRTKSEPESSSGGYLKMMQSVFMAVAGSALSAVVGFLVQDFLKSRKATAPPTQAPSANSAD
jgi:ABC-type phosphate/phosphonate transport system permease subunit